MNFPVGHYSFRLCIQTIVVLDITACGNVTDISRAARGILGVIRSRNSRCSHGEVGSAAPVQLVEDFPTKDPTLHCCNLIYGSFNAMHVSWIALGSLSPFLGDFICNGSLRWMCGSYQDRISFIFFPHKVIIRRAAGAEARNCLTGFLALYYRAW